MSKYDIRVCNICVSVVRIKVIGHFCCLFTSSKTILKLSQWARGHFTTLIENDV